MYHCSIWLSTQDFQASYFETIYCLQRTIRMFLTDFAILLAPFLSGTQYLIYILRGFGAHIGYDVILPNINCLTDPHLSTVGNHVRLQAGAHIQVIYF